VAAEIVEHNDVAGVQCRHENLLDVGREALAVDGTVEDARGSDTVSGRSARIGDGRPPVEAGSAL